MFLEEWSMVVVVRQVGFFFSFSASVLANYSKNVTHLL